MQAILTRFHAATMASPNRWSATCSAGRVVISDGEDGNWDAGHKLAAKKLIDKFGWGDGTDYVGGCLKNGDMAWVPVCLHNSDLIPMSTD